MNYSTKLFQLRVTDKFDFQILFFVCDLSMGEG